MINLTLTEALQKLNNGEISAPDNAGTSRGYFAVPKVMDGE